MEEVTQLGKALYNVRKAHRLLHDYQTRMLDLAYFIKTKLGMPKFTGKKHFSNPISSSSQSDKNIWRDMWAWNFLYSYVFEYYLGVKDVNNKKYAISLIQYSDTGYFDSQNVSSNLPDSFTAEEHCSSKLLIVLEEIDKDGKWNWGDGSSIESIVLNKEYGCSSHEKTTLQLPDGGVQIIYSVPLENMGNEMSVLKELQAFVDYCNNEGLMAFQGLNLVAQSE
ncbi:hypothetical protein [Porphyromonas sp. COT-239 OH1446]|uniref:hypothetical protein n=1 Tax=Porphyromonas sp. COT-239 OH1446 TaxID=1515613 RepID=UPI00052D7013|nr:hypothetical protein [Porphyromonas sp. COT-239 OH1446]KGN68495.1 hypothetical protein HQ37_05890 [Porphyromonas sp. COT-239 OH1446]